MQIPFFRHNIGPAEKRSVNKALDSLILSTGKSVADFESGLARSLKCAHAVGVTSCTGALHIALLAAGVKPGDEVITTALSYVATSHAILMAGATPVFVDVEPETGNIDPKKIKAAITKRTTAIMPVHLYGQMVDMKKILAIARTHKLVVIEDAAHALEAARDGIRPGQKSFGACFSFYATKSITSGEGGAFVSDDAAAAKSVRHLRHHGVDKELVERSKAAVDTYDVTAFGWKYNMDNIQAALLLPQLARVGAMWKRRKAIAERYRKAFTGIVDMPAWIPKATHAHHLFPIWVDARARTRIVLRLKKAGIGVSVNNYPPIHLLSYYRKTFGFKKGDFPVAESIGPRVISLPLYSKLTDKEVAYIIKHVVAAIRETRGGR